MEYTEKMYLVPQRQLDMMKNDARPIPLRQRVENELDGSLRKVMDRSDLHPNEKVKEYTALLQRFLTMVRMGDSDTTTLSLRLPSPDPSAMTRSGPPTSDNTNFDQSEGILTSNVMASEILHNLPPRSKKNASYILDKMNGLWDENTGSFIYDGKPLRGSHIYDLLKVATGNQYIGSRQTPTGWREFITTASQLNLPVSVFPNKKLQSEIKTLKSPVDTPHGSDANTPRTHHSHTPRRQHHSHTPRTIMARPEWTEY